MSATRTTRTATTASGSTPQWLMPLAIGLAVGGAIGWFASSRDEPRANAAHASVDREEERASAPIASPKDRSSATTPTAKSERPTPRAAPEKPSTDDVDDDELAEQAAAARTIASRIREQVAFGAGSIDSPDNAEDVTNRIMDYLVGVAQTLQVASPELLTAMAEEATIAICDPRAKPALTVSWIRLASLLPGALESRAVDCVASRQAGREDLVLWELIDSMRIAQVPPTETLLAAVSHARDPRTLTRLEALAGRSPQDVAQVEGPAHEKEEP